MNNETNLTTNEFTTPNPSGIETLNNEFPSTLGTINTQSNVNMEVENLGGPIDVPTEPSVINQSINTENSTNINSAGENNLLNNNTFNMDNTPKENIYKSNLETPTNSDPVGSSQANKKSKNSSFGRTIKNIIFIIFLLAIIAGIVLFIRAHTAKYFLDSASNLLQEKITNTFNMLDNNTNINSVLKEKVATDWDLSFTSNGETLNLLNNLKLKMSGNLDVYNNYSDVTLNIEQDTAKLSGTILLNDKLTYVESKDLIDKTLFMNNEENYFKSIQDTLNEYGDLLNTNTVKDLLLNSIDYIKVALKESDMKTTQNGINTTYVYDINDTNKELVKEKLINQFNNDSILKKIYKDSNVLEPEDITIDNIKITVSINLFTNKLDSMSIETNDEIINVNKTDKNKYRVGAIDDEENYLEVTILDDKISVISYENNTKTNEIDYESTANSTYIKVSNEAEKFLIDLKLSKANNETTTVFNVVSDTIKATGNLKSITNNNNEQMNGTVNITVSENETLDINFTSDTKWGSDTFTPKSYSNAVDYTTLSDTESNQILINLLIKANNFKIYKEISSMLSSFSNITTDSNDDYYQDDSYLDYNYSF